VGVIATWYDHQPGWVQSVVVTAVLVVYVNFWYITIPATFVYTAYWVAKHFLLILEALLDK